MSYSRLTRRSIVGLAIFLAITSAAGVCMLLERLRQDVLERSRVEAGNLATIVAGQVARSAEAIDLVLEDAQRRVQSIENTNPTALSDKLREKEFYDYLSERLRRLPNADVVSVTDNHGKVVATTRAWPAPDVDLADREHFLVLRESSDGATYVSTPVNNKVTGAPAIYFGKKLTKAHGAFLGAVFIGLRPHKFIYHSQSHLTEIGRSLVLSRRDGMVLIHTETPSVAGRKMPAQSPWHKIVVQGGGHYDSPGLFGNGARLVAVRPIPNVPLVVHAAITLEAALVGWTPTAIGVTIAYLIIGLLFAFLLRHLLSQLDRSQQSEARLEVIALHDNLTGIANRTQFAIALEKMISRASENDRGGAALFIDLDRFKKVNDSLGHSAGDELLQLVAKRLQSCLRPGDLLARQGGDEFIVLLENLAGGAQAHHGAVRLINAIKEPFQLSQGQEVVIGASIGIALIPQDGSDADTLIQHADTALYQAKKAGGSTYRVYEIEQTSVISKRLWTEARMHRALARNEFELHYQPIFSLCTRSIIGAEAVIRWRDPERGLILPAEFIPIAEESGFILPLGDWVTRTACTQAKRWVDKNYDFASTSVNCSAKQFCQEGAPAHLASIMMETGLDPTRLTIEITESALMEFGVDALKRLVALKSLGVSLAIDDFGTGYSSLTYLRRFPIDQLKLDRGFLRDIPQNSIDTKVISGTINWAATLNLRVVAEGIETEEQYACLKKLGCAMGQGYLVGGPMPAAEFEHFARSLNEPAVQVQLSA